MGKSIPNIPEFQKEFENYVSKFELIRELALKLRTSPDQIVELFHAIGSEAIAHTEQIFESELKAKYHVSFTELLTDLEKGDYPAVAKKLKTIINQ